MATSKKDPCESKYEKIREEQETLLKNTPDEEIGKMYRQHKEATEFFSKRGLFV